MKRNYGYVIGSAKTCRPKSKRHPEWRPEARRRREAGGPGFVYRGGRGGCCSVVFLSWTQAVMQWTDVGVDGHDGGGDLKTYAHADGHRQNAAPPAHK